MITTINNAIAKTREDGEKGFTLIELLVVVLIIGILSAIAIPIFLNQRQGAWEAQVQSDIANAVIAAESYSVGNNGYVRRARPRLRSRPTDTTQRRTSYLTVTSRSRRRVTPSR